MGVELGDLLFWSGTGVFLTNGDFTLWSGGGAFLSGEGNFPLWILCGDGDFSLGKGHFWKRVISFSFSGGEDHPYWGRRRPLWPSRLTDRP